jgi:hypothetical protein
MTEHRRYVGNGTLVFLVKNLGMKVTIVAAEN